MLRSSSPLAYRPHRAAYDRGDLGVIQPRPLHVRRSLGVSQKWSFARARACDLLSGFQIILLKKIIAYEFRLRGVRLYETQQSTSQLGESDTVAVCCRSVCLTQDQKISGMRRQRTLARYSL